MKPTNNKPYGLILAGGYSRRMGQDKALIQFHQKPQIEHIYDMLLPFCEQVFVSIRKDQSNVFPYNTFSQSLDLEDFAQVGPLGGILSAMNTYPDISWIVVACDLPFVTPETFQYLLEKHDRKFMATAYRSSSDQLPEPLCAIWEGSFLEQISDLMKEGIRCPRKVLIRSRVHLLDQRDPNWLTNINDPDEYRKFLDSVNS